MDYQSPPTRPRIVEAALTPAHGGAPDAEWRRQRRRGSSAAPATHPDVRIGSSVRGAIDTALVAASPGAVRGRRRSTDWHVGLDAALVALSGRVRVREGSHPHGRGRSCASCGEASFARPPPRRAGRRSGTAPTPARRGLTPTGAEPEPADAPRLDEADPRRRRGRRRRRRGTRAPIAPRVIWPGGTTRFDEVSPEVGVARRGGLRASASTPTPIEALALLADLTRRHRRAAARPGPPAGRARVVLDSRHGSARSRARRHGAPADPPDARPWAATSTSTPASTRSPAARAAGRAARGSTSSARQAGARPAWRCACSSTGRAR